MAYILRALLLIIGLILIGTVLNALGHLSLDFHHIELAILMIIFLIFVEAFVMFYFIGVSRLVDNIIEKFKGKPIELEELFENKVPENLSPYKDKVNQFYFTSQMLKKKTIPWTMLVLTLGCIGFLLGGAHHTGLVSKTIHSGVVYGFIAAFGIGFFKKWKFLGRAHKLLRELKDLFSLSHSSM